MHILVCEDDEDAAQLYKAALEASSHKVFLTFDGHDCLKLFKERIYDLLILDYKLPSIDGLQVARQIISTKPQQRIIFASAFANEAIANSIKALKNDIQLLVKPFEPDFLAQIVEDLE